MRDMSNEEAVQMLSRCKTEIVSLKGVIAVLQPKAEAYESIQAILRLMPQQGAYASEDVVWTIDQRLRELNEAITLAAEQKRASHTKPSAISDENEL